MGAARPRLVDFERPGMQGLQRQERRLHLGLCRVGTGDQAWPARGHGHGLRLRGDRGPGPACAGTRARDATPGGEGGPPTPRPATPGPRAADVPRTFLRVLRRRLQSASGAWRSAPRCILGRGPRGPDARRGAGHRVAATTAASSRGASPHPGTDLVARTGDAGLGTWPSCTASAWRRCGSGLGFDDSRPGARAGRGLCGGQITLSWAHGAVCGFWG